MEMIKKNYKRHLARLFNFPIHLNLQMFINVYELIRINNNFSNYQSRKVMLYILATFRLNFQNKLTYTENEPIPTISFHSLQRIKRHWLYRFIAKIHQFLNNDLTFYPYL